MMPGPNAQVPVDDTINHVGWGLRREGGSYVARGLFHRGIRGGGGLVVVAVLVTASVRVVVLVVRVL